MSNPAQLSLWPETPVPEQQTAEELMPWSPDVILYRDVRWADGDTCPAALERLALVVLDDIEGITRSDGVRLFYRVVATGIVDGVVWRAMEYISTAREFYGGREEQADPQEEEEEF